MSSDEIIESRSQKRWVSMNFFEFFLKKECAVNRMDKVDKVRTKRKRLCPLLNA